MKIAVATTDGERVARHFGRAPQYAVFEVEGGRVSGVEHRAKPGHREFAQSHGPRDEGEEHGHAREADAKHLAMTAPVADCSAVIAGGMGGGAFAAIREAGLEAVITDETDARSAALRYAAGDLPNLVDRLH